MHATTTSTDPSTDSIRKHIKLNAPIARVWRALADSKEFGSWFQIKFDAPFEIGRRMVGQITIRGFEHVKGDMVIERMDEPRLFSYRWHPYAVDPAIDYSKEPMTLVEFRLEETDSGTLLTVTESGFDKLPAHRRGEALRMNTGGWEAQTKNIKTYVES